MREELNRLLDGDIIEESESPYAAPVVLVPKRPNTYRMCIDFRKLNSVTVPDRYPLPRIDDILQNAKHTPYMSTIDLQSGYHQVLVRQKDRDKTSFVTPFGTFRCKRMSFGLRNAPATFQKLIDRFRRAIPTVLVYAYLDDLCILSSDFQSHLKDLETVLNNLVVFKLRANRDKCSFGCAEIKYLGHIITAGGVAVDPEKTAAMRERGEPRNAKEVISFVQTASWFRRFIPNFAEVAQPLTNLTRKKVKWNWGETEKRAFETLKQLLCTAPLLCQADASLRLF